MRYSPFEFGVEQREVPDRVAGAPLRGEQRVIDNLLVRIHFIIVMIRSTGLAPWEFEFPFPGSLTSTFLARCASHMKPVLIQNIWTMKYTTHNNLY